MNFFNARCRLILANRLFNAHCSKASSTQKEEVQEQGRPWGGASWAAAQGPQDPGAPKIPALLLLLVAVFLLAAAAAVVHDDAAARRTMEEFAGFPTSSSDGLDGGEGPFSPFRVDSEGLQRQTDELASFSDSPVPSVTRMLYSDKDVQARRCRHHTRRGLRMGFAQGP